MPEPDVPVRFSDRGGSASWVLALRAVVTHSAEQRAHAERQRNTARSMREAAHSMRARSRTHWPHAS